MFTNVSEVLAASIIRAMSPIAENLSVTPLLTLVQVSARILPSSQRFLVVYVSLYKLIFDSQLDLFKGHVLT
jgi:hypothetical protein